VHAVIGGSIAEYESSLEFVKELGKRAWVYISEVDFQESVIVLAGEEKEILQEIKEFSK